MIKSVTFTLILLSVLLTGCSANANAVQKTQPSTESKQKVQPKSQPKENNAVTTALSRLKYFYSEKEYENVIVTYNEYKISDSNDLNSIYNLAFQTLLIQKQFSTLKNLLMDTKNNIDLNSLPQKTLDEINANVVPLTASNEPYNPNPDPPQTESNNTTNSNSNTLTTDQHTTPQIGMTADEVRATSWGNPAEINKTTTAGVVSEQWVYYYNGLPNRYVYLDNGIVTAVQESN